MISIGRKVSQDMMILQESNIILTSKCANSVSFAGPPVVMQKNGGTLATLLLQFPSSVAKNIRARMKEKEISMNPRKVSGSAKDS